MGEKLTTGQVAEQYGVSTAIVKWWRDKIGCPSFKEGRSVFYDRDAFETWVLGYESEGKALVAARAATAKRRTKATAKAERAAKKQPRKPRSSPWSTEHTVICLQLADDGNSDEQIYTYLKDEMSITRMQWTGQSRSHPVLFKDMDRRRHEHAARSAQRTAATSSTGSSGDGEATWSESELELLSRQGVLKLESVRQSISDQITILKRLKDPDESHPSLAMMRRTLEGVQELLKDEEPATGQFPESNSSPA